MDKLQVVEIKGQRVLTTKQLAEAYETEGWQIKQNYGNNKKRYVKGKHYIELKGEELRDFKSKVENFYLVGKTAKNLYLWTEKGALLHAKSINTDKAWEVYDYLVDFYFRVKEEAKPQQAKEEPGMPVVDIPENMKMQKEIQEIRDYLTALGVELNEINRYISEEKYLSHKAVMSDIAVTLAATVVNMFKAKPKIIKKIY